MLGSQASVSEPNVVINTAVAESLRIFADELEVASDFTSALQNIIKRTIKEHKRIIFNGNGYDDLWLEEAEKRGLLNLKTTPDCLPTYILEKNVKLFETHKVYTETEMHSRYEIMLDNYSKIINIEARTMVDMVKKDILPAVSDYVGRLSGNLASKKSVAPKANCKFEEENILKISALADGIYECVTTLENAVITAHKDEKTALQLALYFRDNIIPTMENLRKVTDEAENLVDRKCWPYPSYGDLLFGVK
jgi:glutamine synthetase